MTKLLKHFKRYGALWIMLILPVTVLILFKYIPMYGVQIAFKNYRITKSIEASPWVGFKYFEKFFSYYDFWPIIRNTLVVNLYSLLTFPIPMIFAVMLTHLPYPKTKKLVQNVTYFPHFISTVVLCSMIIQFSNTYNGLFNEIAALFGIPATNIMAHKESYYSVYVWSDVWRNMGYNSIVYVAALSSVSPDLHEAAIVDGASIVKRIWHIDIPSILPTFCILLIMRCGQLLNVGFEKVLLLQNSLNISVSEVISTYSYNISLNSATPQFSYATAISLFSSIINLIILLSVDKVVKTVNGTTLM